MTERDSYQAGRFEAMSRTRDALTGNLREKANIRSQQLDAKDNDVHQVQTFTKKQFDIKTEVKNTQQAQSRAEIQSAWDTYGQMEQGFLKSEQAWQLDAQLPLEIEQKLGKTGKEQVLSAIQARKAQAEKVANANTEAVAQEQALTQQEIKLEADKLLAMAPESLLAGSLAALAIWVINRLPNKVYKTTAIATVLSLALAACSTINSTPTAEIPTQSGAVASETVDTNPSPEATEVTAAELEKLNTDINHKIDEAVKKAAISNPAAAAQFEENNGAETTASIFASRLAAERILDPKAYEISLISANGQARLELTAESPWGAAGDVSVIDTGEKDGLFLSLEGGLESLGIAATPENIKNYEIVFDEGGWYALIKDKSDNLIGVVGQEKKWTADIENAQQLEKIDESSLSYEQQKTMIESRFEKGSQAFEALIKEDGNLEYYDGTWKTLEAMRNLNGEIIPWGESYDMVSEEGRSGILTNIMAGNTTSMDQHIDYSFDVEKRAAEDEGIDSANFNILYVQFFPNVGSLTIKDISKEIGHHEIQGQIVVKSIDGKICVVNIKTYFNNTVLNTYVKSENTIARSSSYMYESKAFDNSFLGINSAELLNFLVIHYISRITSMNDAEQAWLEKILRANMGSLTQKNMKDLNTISENLYIISSIIYPNY